MTRKKTAKVKQDKNAPVVYYGKEFRPFGEGWVENGLSTFVSMSSLNTILVNQKIKVPASATKEDLVKAVMVIYNKSDSNGKARIEKFVYSHRYRRATNKGNPFLKRVSSFFNYLETNNFHKIKVNPSTASQFIRNLTMRNITDFSAIKYEMKSSVAKNQKDADAFDALFDLWFTDNYGIAPEPPKVLHSKIHSGTTSEEMRAAILETIGYAEAEKEAEKEAEEEEEKEEEEAEEEEEKEKAEEEEEKEEAEEEEEKEEAEEEEEEEEEEEAEKEKEEKEEKEEKDEEPDEEPEEPEEPDEEPDEEPEEPEEPDKEEEEKEEKEEIELGEPSDADEGEMPTCPVCNSELNSTMSDDGKTVTISCSVCGWSKTLKIPENKTKDPEKINEIMLKALINDGNIIELGNYLGYSTEEVLSRISKINYVIDDSIGRYAAGAAAYEGDIKTWTGNGDNWKLMMSSPTMKAIKKYYDKNQKPQKYWDAIATFQHEMIHVFTDVPPKLMSIEWEEAKTPLIQYIWLNHYNGALNPLVLNVSDEHFDRMSMQKSPVGRVGYPPKTFKYFDQLVQLYYLDSDLFREIIKETIQNKMTSETLFKYVQRKYNLWKM